MFLGVESLLHRPLPPLLLSHVHQMLLAYLCSNQVEAQRFETRAAGLAAEYTSGAQSILSGIQGIGQSIAGYEASQLEQERFDLGQSQDRTKMLGFIKNIRQKGIVDPAEIEALYNDAFGSS